MKCTSFTGCAALERRQWPILAALMGILLFWVALISLTHTPMKPFDPLPISSLPAIGINVGDATQAVSVVPANPALPAASPILSSTQAFPKFDFGQVQKPFRHVTVLYSGLTKANLEVCGCPNKPMGGIAPRAAVIEESRQIEKGRILVLDAGRFMTSGDELDRKRSEVYLRAMSTMGYDAVALSSADFVQGYDFLKEQAAQTGFPFLSCNLKFDDGGEGFWRPYIIKDLGDTKIGVIGFTNPDKPIPAGNRSIQITDPAEALAGIISEVSAQVDAVIAIGSVTDSVVHGQQQLWDIASKVKGLDVLIGSVLGMPKRDYGEGANKTIVLSVIEDGKQLGRLDMNIFNNGEIYAKVNQIELKKGMEREPAIRRQLNEFYQSIMSDPKYNSKVKDVYAGLAEEKDPDNAYVGHKACESCHKPQYFHWMKTDHYRAFFTLLEEKKYFVPECLSCHTTGYNQPTGFGRTEEESLMRDVQCEACHGPGKKHIDAQGKGFMRRTMDQAFCERCHDEANSPHFKEQYNSKLTLIKH